MRLRSFRACAGLRLESVTSSAIVDLYEVPDLAQHACEDRAVVVLHGLADLAEAECPQGAAVALALADLATNLSYPDFRHPDSPEEPPALRPGQLPPPP